MSSTALAVVREPSAAVADARRFADFIDEKRAIIKANFGEKASPAEFDLFIGECKMRMLSPFAKQIYLIPFGSKHVTIVSLHGLRLIAARTGEYAGSDPYVYDAEDGPNPNKATCTVWKMVQGVRCPFTSAVRWKERNKGQGEWKSQPYHMLGKCAESDALRKAFPEECGGLYTDDEMAGLGPDIAEPPLRATGLLPSGLREDQFGRLAAEASQRGVHLTRGMTLDQMAAQIAERGGPQIPGVVKAGDIWGALKRVPQPAADAPARPARQSRQIEPPAPAVASVPAEEPLAGEMREERPEVDPETGEIIPPHVGKATEQTAIDF